MKMVLRRVGMGSMHERIIVCGRCGRSIARILPWPGFVRGILLDDMLADTPKRRSGQ